MDTKLASSSADHPAAPAEPDIAGKSGASFFMRAFWYGIAGVVTLALNPALFTLFHDHLGWANTRAYAASLLLVNVLQFLWSYHIGFRTHEHWTISAKRQGATLVFTNALNYVLVIALQAVFPLWKNAVIVAVQAFIAVIKFFIYHYWVYPHRAAGDGTRP